MSGGRESSSTDWVIMIPRDDGEPGCQHFGFVYLILQTSFPGSSLVLKLEDAINFVFEMYEL